MARGRGGKAKRGGGHSFSKDLVLNEDGIAVSHERRGYVMIFEPSVSIRPYPLGCLDDPSMP